MIVLNIPGTVWAYRHRHTPEGRRSLRLGFWVFMAMLGFPLLACVLETPGPDRSGPTADELALCRRLRDGG